jgi:hypothetical protein
MRIWGRKGARDHPARAKAVAIPSPMPDAAPVTNTVFPASSFTRILPVRADTLAPKPSLPGRHMTAFTSDWEACRMSVRGRYCCESLFGVANENS